MLINWDACGDCFCNTCQEAFLDRCEVCGCQNPCIECEGEPPYNSENIDKCKKAKEMIEE